MSERQVLINLIAGFSLADHMGDAWRDCYQALKQIGIELPDDIDDDSDVAAFLVKEHGAKTVWGTSLLDDE